MSDEAPPPPGDLAARTADASLEVASIPSKIALHAAVRADYQNDPAMVPKALLEKYKAQGLDHRTLRNWIAAGRWKKDRKANLACRRAEAKLKTAMRRMPPRDETTTDPGHAPLEPPGGPPPPPAPSAPPPPRPGTVLRLVPPPGAVPEEFLRVADTAQEYQTYLDRSGNRKTAFEAVANFAIEDLIARVQAQRKENERATIEAQQADAAQNVPLGTTTPKTKELYPIEKLHLLARSAGELLQRADDMAYARAASRARLDLLKQAMAAVGLPASPQASNLLPAPLGKGPNDPPPEGSGQDI
jgi:hypothetical protein